MKANMTMDTFFSMCGSYLGYIVYSHEDSEKIKIVCFDYKNGYSTYDGRNWSYWICSEVYHYEH